MEADHQNEQIQTQAQADAKHYEIMNEPLTNQPINCVNLWFRKHPAKLQNFLSLANPELFINEYAEEGTSGDNIAHYISAHIAQFDQDETEDAENFNFKKYLFDYSTNSPDGLKYEILKFIVYYLFDNEEQKILISILLTATYLIHSGMKNDFIILTKNAGNKDLFSLKKLYEYMTEAGKTSTQFLRNLKNFSPRMSIENTGLNPGECIICTQIINYNTSPFNCACSLNKKICASCCENLHGPIKQRCPQCRTMSWTKSPNEPQPRKVYFNIGQYSAFEYVNKSDISEDEIMLIYPIMKEYFLHNSKKKLRKIEIKKVIIKACSVDELRKQLLDSFMENLVYTNAEWLQQTLNLPHHPEIIKMVLTGWENSPTTAKFYELEPFIHSFLGLSDDTLKGLNNRALITRELLTDLSDNSSYADHKIMIQDFKGDELILLMEDKINENIFANDYTGDVIYINEWIDGTGKTGNFMNYFLNSS